MFSRVSRTGLAAVVALLLVGLGSSAGAEGSAQADAARTVAEAPRVKRPPAAVRRTPRAKPGAPVRPAPRVHPPAYVRKAKHPLPPGVLVRGPKGLHIPPPRYHTLWTGLGLAPRYFTRFWGDSDAPSSVVVTTPPPVVLGQPIAMPQYLPDKPEEQPRDDSLAALLACAAVLQQAFTSAGLPVSAAAVTIDAPEGEPAALTVAIHDSGKLADLADALDGLLGADGLVTANELPGRTEREAAGYWIALEYDLPASIGTVYAYSPDSPDDSAADECIARLVVTCFAEELTPDLKDLADARSGSSE